MSCQAESNGRPSVLQMVTAPVLGGAQDVLCTLARDQLAHGFAVAAATSPGGPLAPRLRGLGIPTLETHLERGLRVGSILALRRFVRQHRVSIVHAHGARAVLHAFWATRWQPAVKLIAHVHLFDEWRFDGSRRARLDRYVSSRADRVIACSETLRRALVERQGLPAARTLHIPNGIALDRFEGLPPRAEARSRLGLAEQDLVAGACLRLEPTKGVAHLIEAAARLAGRLPHLRLVIAGDGSLRASLERAAAEAGLAGRVLWLGHRQDVPALLAAFDLFVLPSLVEGLPLSVLEAMAAGVPVIGTAIDGTLELIGEGRGLAVRPGSADELERAILDLAQHPELGRRLARTAWAFVRVRHSSEAMATRIRELYLSLLTEASPLMMGEKGNGP